MQHDRDGRCLPALGPPQLGKVKFRQADLRRALRAAKAEGFQVSKKIEIEDGRITITTGTGDVAQADTSLDEWLEGRARKVEGR